MKKLLIEKEAKRLFKKLLPLIVEYDDEIPEEVLTFQQKNHFDFLIEHGFVRKRSEEERLFLDAYEAYLDRYGE